MKKLNCAWHPIVRVRPDLSFVSNKMTMRSSSAVHSHGEYLDRYVLHAHYSPLDPEVLLWHVVGKRVELSLRSVTFFPSSRLLDATALGLKESVLADMRTWTRLWMYHNGREDPRSEHFSPAYLEAKRNVETLSGIIHTSVKKYFAEHPRDPTHE
jgi:hypothetical protein